MREVLLVGIGGFAGANARHLVSTLVARKVDPSLPWGTLVVNVAGSLVIGFILAWTTERVLTDSAYRTLVVVGFCGAFTTFSSYAFETVRLIEQGHYAAAMGNFLSNNVLAVLAVIAGVALARWV